MSEKNTEVANEAFSDIMECMKLSVRFLGKQNKRDLKKHVSMSKPDKFKMLRLMIEEKVL